MRVLYGRLRGFPKDLQAQYVAFLHGAGKFSIKCLFRAFLKFRISRQCRYPEKTRLNKLYLTIYRHHSLFRRDTND